MDSITTLEGLSGSVHTLKVINGTNGDDSIQGTSHADQMNGLAGNDALWGMSGDDTIDGGKGNDYLSGGLGNDSLLGGIGSDTVYGDAGNDFIDGGAGADTLYGNAGSDTIFGGDGNDFIQGGRGTGVLYGGAGDDVIWGWNKNGMEGDDGADTFHVAGIDGLKVHVSIVDYQDEDTIDLSDFGFTADEIKYDAPGHTLTARNHEGAYVTIHDPSGHFGDESIAAHIADGTLVI